MGVLNLRETEQGIVLQVRVLPRSSRCEVVGVQDGALKLKITAPPVEGQANEECIRFLSQTLGVKKNQVTIIRGHKARVKTVAVSGVKTGDIERLANPLP